MKTLISVLLMLAVVVAHADNAVIGKIQFVLDGEEQTWYVLESPDGLRSNALWMDIGPGKSAIAVTAFASPDITLVSDGTMGSAVPDGSTPALVISVAFPAGAKEQSHTLPAPATDGPAIVMLLNNWSNPIDSAMLSDGPGEIRLTSINASKDSPSSFAGTFSGALKDGEGNARTIESGRFEFEQVEFFERP